MYKLKDIARRSTALVAAVTMLSGVVSAAVPALASADALNPLTERSLMLSSSSPGHHFVDGSGNSTYAPPGSGPNGKKTGETFTFKVSTDSTGAGPGIKAFSLQYCDTPAGQCMSPGNGPLASTTSSSLNVNYASNPVEGTDFSVSYMNGSTLTPSTGWTMTADRLADGVATNGVGASDDADINAKNYIILSNSTPNGMEIPAGTQVAIKFNASETNYITNPGAGAFFVKINDFDTDNAGDIDPIADTDHHIIDGGVTVANVMNDSIQIQTKVLETMSFSVGTTNPDTVIHTGGGTLNHGSCDAITTNAPINLGNENAEYSLSPSRAYDGFSYWRLASNSSNGATVYYAGYTLKNTNQDEIQAIHAGDGIAATSNPGSEQFGLAIQQDSKDTYDTSDTPDLDDVDHNVLTPLVADAKYALGNGSINSDDPVDTAHPDPAQFAFKSDANTNPVAIATEPDRVIHCATAKMRYLANIAPDTPAGIYTSKINYIASPQY